MSQCLLLVLLAGVKAFHMGHLEPGKGLAYSRSGSSFSFEGVDFVGSINGAGSG